MDALSHFNDVFNAIPFNRILGLKLNTITPDHITISFSMKKDFVGNYMQRILHGGVTSSVLDMAGGAAAMASIIQKNPSATFEDLASSLGKSSTINLNINFLRPGKGEYFEAKAWIERAGKKIIFTRMELINEENHLIATANGTYSIS